MGKSNNVKLFLVVLLCTMLAIGCGKNETTYYPDSEDPGLAIFSKAGYNILTCYVDGKVWRTEDRITRALSSFGTSYELYINRRINIGLRDTIQMQWRGYFDGNRNLSGVLSLQVVLPSRLNAGGLTALNGQRLQLDTANSYFSFAGAGVVPVNRKGTGNIYFHTARYDTIGNNVTRGGMSGLFDADFGNFKITRGRFDHTIMFDQVRF